MVMGMMNADQIEIRTGLAAMDLNMVCDFLPGSYWGKGRTREQILKSCGHSICFGAFVEGRHVGFARVVTDQVFYAFIFDVFVLEEFRGRGIAKAMMEAVLTNHHLCDVESFMLGTADAHGFYEPFGFRTITDPSRLMVRARPRASQTEGQ